MTPRADRSAPRDAGTRALLDAFAEGDPESTLRLGELFAGLGKRSFGMLVFVATLPGFLPVPGVAGALSGPFVALLGLQLLVGRADPWLPAFVARRGPKRATMARFRDRVSPWLQRLEGMTRPQLRGVLDHRLASAFTGLQLVLLGLLLMLPIPLTNYLFAGLILLYAFALLERDGRLMVLAWVAGLAGAAVVAVLSGSLAAVIAQWFEHLRG